MAPKVIRHVTMDLSSEERVIKLHSLIRKREMASKVDIRIAKAFKLWQRALLDQYLDLLSQRMREAKRSVLI